MEGLDDVLRGHKVVDDLNTAVQVLDLEHRRSQEQAPTLPDIKAAPPVAPPPGGQACGGYLVHGARGNEDGVSKELDDGPSVDSVLIQQPLPLLPAQVPGLLSDRVLVLGRVGSLLLAELRR